MEINLRRLLGKADFDRLVNFARDKENIPDLLEEIIVGWLDDGRRSHQVLIPKSMRWPYDWWERMHEMWGPGNIQWHVRKITRRAIKRKDPTADLSELPPFIDRERTSELRDVTDKPIVMHWPEDWYAWMEDNLDYGEISGFVKQHVLRVIDNDPSNPLSEQRGRGRPV